MARRIGKFGGFLAWGALLLTSAVAIAASGGVVGSFLEVSPNSREDLSALLNTIEETLPDNSEQDNPIVVILHGDEAFAFTRENYQSNKSLVDRAALLDAFEMIDIRICETWMNKNGISRSDVPPFIDTIPFAPEEIRRLEAEGYAPYPAVQL